MKVARPMREKMGFVSLENILRRFCREWRSKHVAYCHVGSATLTNARVSARKGGVALVINRIVACFSHYGVPSDWQPFVASPRPRFSDLKFHSEPLLTCGLPTHHHILKGMTMYL